MGEGWDQMYREASASSARAEEDELGESSSLSGGSDDEAAAESSHHNNRSSACSSHADSHGPLHELSSLVSQLPIKKGLSKFYEGKSRSLSSFSDVTSVEDLAKRERAPIERRMNPSRSYAGGLDQEINDEGRHQKASAVGLSRGIPKKGPRASCASSIARTTSAAAISPVASHPTSPRTRTCNFF